MRIIKRRFDICLPKTAGVAMGHQGRNGFVLVIVLAVLAFVSLICYRYTDQMTLEREAASLAVREVQSRLWAKSGVEVAMAMMAMPDFDGLGMYDDLEIFSQQSVMLSDGSGPAGAFSILVGADTVTGMPLRYGMDSEGGKINLNSLSQSELTEDEQREILLTLPNMTETLADTILDYLDSDANARAAGTESDEEGYLIRNGPLSSLDDLLNIPGVTLEILYGEDLNGNRRLDPNEDDGDLRWPTDNGDGVLNYGWDHYLTLWSAESNLTPEGEPRINLNVDDLSQLKTDLSTEFGDDVANFIIAYRLYGPVQSSSSQDANGGSSSGGSGGSSGSGGSGGSSGGNSSGGSSSGSSGRGGGGNSSGSGNSGGGRSGSSSGGGGGSSSGTGSGTTTQANSGSSSGVSQTTSQSTGSSGGGNSGGGGSGSSSSGVNTVTGGTSSSGVNTINSKDTSSSSQTTSNGGSSNSTNNGGGGGAGLDTTQQPKFELTSIYELFDVSVQYQDGDNDVTLTSPWVSADLSVLQKIEEMIGMSDEVSIPGRIDLNYATREVLTGLPNITTSMVDGILSKQGSWVSTGEMLQEGLVTIDQMRKLDQFITTGSKTFHLQSVGYPETGTQSVRVEAIIDSSSGVPKLVWMRDLTMLGSSYDEAEVKPSVVE